MKSYLFRIKQIYKKVKEIDELVKTRSKYITQEGTPFIFDFIKTIKNLTLIKLRISN